MWRLGAAAQALRDLRSWDRKGLLAYQARCLAAVTRHAATGVPYYRRLFAAAGLAQDAVCTPADLARVPISTRRALQDLPPRDLVASGLDPERLVNLLSSGSTGEPFTTRRTRVENRLLLAFRLRIFQALGVGLLERWAGLLWLDREESGITVQRRLVPRRGRTISCLAPISVQIDELRRTDFTILVGLTGTLAEAAEVLTEADRARLRPRLVVTGGESSTAEQRARLAERFGTGVIDTYGTNEFMATAWQCPQTGLYHVSDPTVILEVVDEHGRAVPEGAEGEVVGTALHAWAMPLVRYRLDDIAVRGPTPCPCGAPWSTLVRIQGRVSERFRLTDGTAIHPYRLQETFMAGAAWLGGFQIIQERLDLVRLRLRPLRGVPVPPEGPSHAVAAVKTVLGADVEVTAELVEELPRGGRGKSLHYVCNVR